ncbi:MAG TPA: molybdopterin dinucleotide binding domain-containing protein, partial [Methylomirabilota bacterium]|nr:molybdopterin dinucleotide binding domain-containing protein [Methylomirabilota bacterium]
TPLVEAHDAGLARRYPLQCIVPPNRFFLNSSFSQSALLRKRQAGAAVFIHPDDAAARGIVPGELVAVWNDRGRALFTAVLTDDTPPGQVVIEGIWWHKFMPGGRGVNVLTSDKVADLGGGPAFHSTMVEVERAPSSAETSWRHLAGTAAP